MPGFFRVLAVAAVMAIGHATVALAHAHLMSATPPKNAVVAASPSELDLQFSEALDLAFSGITLRNADKVEIPTGAARLVTADGTLLVVPLPQALPAGVYTVEWHALSTDGHKTKGSYSFTVRP